MIRKLGVIVVLAALMCSMVQAGPSVFWSSQEYTTAGTAPNIVDRFGAPIPTTSTWAAQILKTSDESVLWSAQGAQWSDYATPGVFYEALTADDSWLNVPVFTRLYDNANPASASWKADVGATTLTWVTSPPQTDMTYNIGTVAQGQWTAIPEPGTMALLGLGMLTVAVRRRFKK